MMKTRLSVAIFGLAMMTVGFMGCAANRIDLVGTATLKLEKQREGKVYIAWASVYEKDDGVVISGVLRRHDHIGNPIKTHVDVTVLSPDGRVIDTARSNEVYVPRRITGRGQSLKRFVVHLPNLPPRGSLVRMTSHSGPHNDSA